MNIILLHPNDFTANNQIVTLSDDRFIHIKKILKLSVGDTLKVGLINGNLGRGKVIGLDDKSITLTTILDVTPPKPENIKLVVALPRPQTLKKVLYSATTYGVKDITFINSNKVEKSYWQSPLINTDKYMNTITDALQQSCDTIVPSVNFEKRFRPFVEDILPEIVKERTTVLFHPTDSEFNYSKDNESGYTIIIGPEGGFTPYEVDKFIEIGCKLANLGERILRVEHAVDAVLGFSLLS